MQAPGGLAQEAYAAALASLPGVGPGWLAELLSRRLPKDAWELVISGQALPPKASRLRSDGDATAYAQWVKVAQLVDVGALWQRCRDNSICVEWLGAAGYPRALAGGPAPPGVLFSAGQLAWVERRPVVAVVGTRRCTPEGASTAYHLARELATAGVCVVSGLALGIDGAAHAGALEGFRVAVEGSGTAPTIAVEGPGAAPTVGVAASGVDVAYPRQHAALWRQVVATGAVISETPPGTPAQSWRFPARNRVIAGLARMVVVVESHVTGGSWHTVDAALRRGVEVAAVPGSVHSPASAGTNALLRDGATPVRGAQDVLDALGLQGGALAPPKAGDARSNGRGTAVEAPAPLAEKVLAALGWRPRCLEELVERSGLPVGAAVVVLDQLEAAGEIVSSEDGWWCRRT